MSKHNGQAWNTKYGRRRVRQEEPTLEEAITAARGLSDDPNEQAEIAAALIGMPQDRVLAALLKAAPRNEVVKSMVFTGRASTARTVVVERKPARRMIAGADRPHRSASQGVRG